MLYILQLFILALVGIGVATSYYNSFPIHGESSTGYFLYGALLVLLYGTYKIVQMFYGKNKVRFTPLKIVGYTLAHIFIICITYFNAIESSGSFMLFCKIIGYSLLPAFIGLISYSFGKKILRLIPGYNNEHEKFQTIMNLAIGFILFLTPVIVAGMLGFYNLWMVFGVLFLYAGVAIKELIETGKSLATYTIEFENHKSTTNVFENVNLELLSTEFLFIILTFLIGVNLINIVRPMPIGWDDLGVYMNFPNIIAQNGKLLAGNGMIAWQTFTGIGFLFKSTAQAFFLSDLGGILSLIVCGLSLSYFTSEKKKTFINLPLLACAILFAMPMVIFQQAKDIKVDLGLLFMSISAIFSTLYLSLKYLGFQDSQDSSSQVKDENSGIFGKIKSVFKGSNGISETFDGKTGFLYVLLVGILVGFAFSIKATSLMLILAIIGVFAYVKIGLAGFFGYFFLFIGFFTKLHLWEMMNVNYPKDDVHFINVTFIVCLILALLFLGYGAWRYSLSSFKKLGVILCIFFVGIGITISPWLIKNISETGIKNISIGALLNGKGDDFIADYTKIHSQETLDVITKKQVESQATSSSGKTINEDLGRYFGYDDGVNNYLKLPYNLTMQTNQPGEYTDITFIFLALFPVILLFLGYKNPLWGVGVVGGIIFAGLYYFSPTIGDIFTKFFATQTLPSGYIWIVGAFLLPLPYFIYSLNHSRNSQVFRLLLVVSSFYCLIFVVAAYGIVWYGIAMYFMLLAMITIAGENLVGNDGTEDAGNVFRFIGSLTLLTIVSIYFFNSSIPHGFKNIKNAGFTDFKAGRVTQSEGIFGSHPDYYSILTELNLSDKTKAYNEIVGKITNPNLIKVINQFANGDINKLAGVLQSVINLQNEKISTDPIVAQTLKADAKDTLEKVYDMVLYPTKELRNTKNIYRIGTFLTYFINNNRTRYYDDSLIFNFDTYFYDKDPDVTIDRMKKVGLSYFLVDLNAATIDRDPRHDLTRRFENLLSSFKSSKLELVQTDSVCLHLALDEKDKNYLTYAGVNSESYTSEKTISRREKFYSCIQHIAELAQDGKVTNDGKYSYLVPIVQFLQANGKNMIEEKFNQLFDASHGWLALFRIK